MILSVFSCKYKNNFNLSYRNGPYMFMYQLGLGQKKKFLCILKKEKRKNICLPTLPKNFRPVDTVKSGWSILCIGGSQVVAYDFY